VAVRSEVREGRVPPGERALRAAARPFDGLEALGRQLYFYGRVPLTAPWAVTRYFKEVLRLLTEVSFGTGALTIIGGTLGVMIGMTMFTGTIVGLQGYAALNQMGTSALTGFIAAYFDTREVAPLSAGLALSATVGCGFTAQLGAMRISEEVDALEVMAVPSLPFLVTTRVIAGLLAVVPLYVLGLLSSYFATRTIATVYFGQSPGTYDYYFHLFLPPGDVLWSFGKALVFSVIVVLIHCYYGYNASGGPVGVGTATAKSMVLNIVLVHLIGMLGTQVFWGANPRAPIGG
jgi:phospholipid/cholesterol/gamma-HCH transport system permease protein